MAGRWFSRVVWIGVVCNLALAVPTLVAPGQTMALTGIPPASPLLWPQFSALLLILLSVFYIPAALDFARYRVTAWNQRMGQAYWGLTPAAFRRQVGRLITRLPQGVRRYAQRSFLALPPGIRSLFHENFAAFPDALRGQLLRNPALRDADPYVKQLARYEESPGGMLARMSRADLQTYLVELLTKQDRMSMAASVESRVPFLDHELVEHVLALPERFKVRGWTTKAVLRRALKGRVPREILILCMQGRVRRVVGQVQEERLVG